MALFNKESIKKPIQEDFSLTADEIEIVLRLLATTNFPVKDIESLYKSIYKLQEQLKQKLNING
jgi:hypothetical protein